MVGHIQRQILRDLTENGWASAKQLATETSRSITEIDGALGGLVAGRMVVAVTSPLGAGLWAIADDVDWRTVGQSAAALDVIEVLRGGPMAWQAILDRVCPDPGVERGNRARTLRNARASLLAGGVITERDGYYALAELDADEVVA